jgi:alkylation response protein AidB-like acyl-CoA dehydrogenase
MYSGALAMTEPSGGSDLQSMKSVAVRDEDDWILNGSKVFISSGYQADFCLVCCVTDKETPYVIYLI